MDVATPLADNIYWVIYVTSPDEPDGVTRVDRRFEFRGEWASIRAWNCYESAQRHGMSVRVEKVRSRVDGATHLIAA